MYLVYFNASGARFKLTRGKHTVCSGSKSGGKGEGNRNERMPKGGRTGYERSESYYPISQPGPLIRAGSEGCIRDYPTDPNILLLLCVHSLRLTHLLLHSGTQAAPLQLIRSEKAIKLRLVKSILIATINSKQRLVICYSTDTVRV